MSYHIQSTKEWVDTEFSLPPTKNDKRVTITVNGTSRWTANSHAGGGGLYDVRGWQGRKPGGGGYKVQHADEGCLVGRIGGSPFLFTFDEKPKTEPPKTTETLTSVGGKFILEFDVDGQLSGNIFMGINDAATGLGDNGGVIEVEAIDWIEKGPRP